MANRLQRTFGRWGNIALTLLPRSLQLQLMLLVSLCLVTSLLGYAYYTAQQQTHQAQREVSAQLKALAHNLATVSQHFLS